MSDLDERVEAINEKICACLERVRSAALQAAAAGLNQRSMALVRAARVAMVDALQAQALGLADLPELEEFVLRLDRIADELQYSRFGTGLMSVN